MSREGLASPTNALKIVVWPSSSLQLRGIQNLCGRLTMVSGQNKVALFLLTWQQQNFTIAALNTNETVTHEPYLAKPAKQASSISGLSKNLSVCEKIISRSDAQTSMRFLIVV